MAQTPSGLGGSFGSRPSSNRSVPTNKRRTQVADPTEVQRLRPQAVPVNQFVAPLIEQNPDTTPLTELAGALKGFGPAVDKFAKQKQKRFEDDEIAAGIRAFQENRVSYREAIEKGLIPPQNSPHFQNAFEGQELRLLGKDYELALRTAFAESPASQSDDPAVFNTFVGEFTKQYMAEKTGRFQDTQIVEDFIPEISRSQNILQQRHVEARTKAITDGLLLNAQKEQIILIDRGIDDGADTPTIAAALQRQLDTNTEAGLDRLKANKSLIENIVQKAKEDGNPEILDILKHVQTRDGGKLGDTKFARLQIEKAKDAIARDEERSYRFDKLKEAEAKKEAATSIMTVAFGAIIKDPDTDLSVELGKLAAIDPTAASNLQRFSEASKNADARVRSNPKVIAQLYAQLDDTDNGEALILAHAGAEPPLISSNEAQDAFRYYKSNKANKGPLRSPQYKEAAKDLFSLVKGVSSSVGDAQIAAAAAIQAKRKLRRAAQSWLEKNTKDGIVDMGEFELFLDNEMDRIIRSPRFRDTATSPAVDFLEEGGFPAPPASPLTPKNPFDQFDPQLEDDGE